jgi:hypothetical protein
MTWQKLGLLIGALLLPTAIAGLLYLQGANAAVRSARAEVSGAEYVQALARLRAELVNHRGQLASMKAANATDRAAVLESETRLDQLARAVESVDAELGSELQTSHEWQQFRRRWSEFRGDEFTLSESRAFAEHDELLRRLAVLATSAEMNSGLATDPEYATYGLFTVASIAPRTVETLGVLQARAAAVAFRKTMDDASRTVMDIYRSQTLGNIQDMQVALERSADSVPEVRDSILPVLVRSRVELDRYVSFLDYNVIGVRSIALDGAAAYNSGTATLHGLMDLTDVAYAALIAALQERAQHLSAQRAFALIVALTATSLALLLAVLIARSLTRPLRQAVTVSSRIAAGQYDNAIASVGTDEPAMMLRSLQSMQTTLKASAAAMQAMNATVRRAVESAKRTKSANESASSTAKRGGVAIGSIQYQPLRRTGTE